MGRGPGIDVVRSEWSDGSVLVDAGRSWLVRQARAREEAAAVRRRAALDASPGPESARALARIGLPDSAWADHTDVDTHVDTHVDDAHADVSGCAGGADRADERVAAFAAARRLEAWGVWQQLVQIAALLAERGGVAVDEAAGPSDDAGDAGGSADSAGPTAAARRPRRHVDPGGLVEECVITEIALAAGVSEHLATRRVVAAKALVVDDRLPGMAALLREGAVDWVTVQVVVTRTQTLDHASARAVDALVAPQASGLSLRRFEQAVDRAVLRVDAAAAEERRRRARRDRAVAVFADGDGTATLWARGPAEAVVSVTESLTAVARHLRRAGDPRTLEQLRFDLLVTGCTIGFLPLPVPPSPQDDPATDGPGTGGTGTEGTGTQRTGTQRTGPVRGASGAGPGTGGEGEPDDGCPGSSWGSVVVPDVPDVPAHITVTVSLETLLGLVEDPGMLDGYGPVPATVARDLAVNGVWRCVAVDGTHGTVLGVGRSTFTPGYSPGAALRTFLEYAVPTCTVPTCGARAWRCDLDHRLPWQQGGPTCDCNVRALCRRHHRLKTTRRLRLTVSTDPDEPPGTWVVTTPTGRSYLARPHAPLPRDEVPRDGVRRDRLAVNPVCDNALPEDEPPPF